MPVVSSEAARKLHKEHAYFHTLLTIAPTQEARAEVAHTILTKIIPALDAEYARLRQEEWMSPAELDEKLARKIMSIRVRISQIKKEMKTARGKRLADLEKQLELKQAEYDNIT